MNTPNEEPPRPGLSDLPRLIRSTVDRGIDLASARIELIQAEIREEAEKRLRRLPHIVIPAVFLVLGFMLLNVALVAWLAEAIGLTAAAFSLAGLYLAIGAIGTWLFLKGGGLNPPDRP
ncbi:MAG TPA: phage holin family protein [Candidatus Eisenbacteria bacterium]